MVHAFVTGRPLAAAAAAVNVGTSIATGAVAAVELGFVVCSMGACSCSHRGGRGHCLNDMCAVLV